MLHTFTLAAAKRVYVDSLENNGNLLWSLSGPLGTLVSDRRFDQTDSENGLFALDLPAGNYTFTVAGLGRLPPARSPSACSTSPAPRR